MRKGSFVFLVGVMFAAFLVVSPTLVLGEVTVEPWFVEEMSNNEVLLEPGTTVYCNKNFSVENMGKETAEVFIIRGNGDNYDRDMIPAKGKLSYKLRDRSIFATEASRGNWVSEARIVNSTLGDANLKIRCK